MRQKVNLYNVLDLEGKVLHENVSAREIAERTGQSQSFVLRAVQRGNILSKEYRVELAQERMPDGDDLAKQKLLEEWDEIRTPFLRVRWVKEMGKGVKRLR